MGKETVYQTAIRELFEETGIIITIDALQLVDVRSDPRRDPRGHVLDIGFLSIIKDEKTLPERTDETFPEWIPFEKVKTLEFAFDHREMFENLKKYIP